jgi:hypothetical protein
MLKDTLTGLVQRADEKFPDAVGTGQLTGGLYINLRRVETGKESKPFAYTLTLWRYGVHPSEVEWGVVCRNWPYEVGRVHPGRGQAGNRFYLRGRMPCGE